MNAIASRIDATEGQVWSLGIGIVVATLLAVVGIPPVLHHERAVTRRLPQVAASPSSASPSSQQLSSATAGLVAQPSPETAVSEGSLPASASPMLSVGPAPEGPAAPVPVPSLFGTIAVIASESAPLAGIAAGRNGALFAATDIVPSHVYSYDPAGRRTGDLTIAGQPDQSGHGITGLAVGSDGTLVATDAASARVLHVDPAGRHQTTVATIPRLTPCLLSPGATMCKQGLADNPPALTGIVATPNDTLFVADSGQGIIWRIRPHDKPEVWSQPIEAVSGNGQTALALAPDHSIVYTVGSDLDPSNLTAASVYRVAVRPDGSAEPPVLLTKLARGDQPTGIAVSADGRIFVALHAAGSVVVLRPDGSELTRIRAPAIDGPVGLAMAGPDELIATTHPRSGPSKLLRIGVAHQPAVP